jgi:hypothetical protein
MGRKRETAWARRSDALKTVAATLVLCALVLVLPGCLDCAARGNWFVGWRNGSLYDAVTAPSPPPATSLPFDRDVEGFPPGTLHLQVVQWSPREGVGFEIRPDVGRNGTATGAFAWTVYYDERLRDEVRPQAQLFLQKTTSLNDSAIEAATDRLLDGLHDQRSVLLPVDTPFAFEAAWIEAGEPPIRIPFGLVGSGLDASGGEWRFFFAAATKTLSLDGDTLTVFPTGDAKLSYHGSWSSASAAIGRTKAALAAHGLPADLDRPQASFSNDCGT